VAAVELDVLLAVRFRKAAAGRALGEPLTAVRGFAPSKGYDEPETDIHPMDSLVDVMMRGIAGLGNT
jgi:hypothetical protein